MRYFLGLVLALLFVLSLSACGGDDIDTDIGGGGLGPCDLMITEIMNFSGGTLLGNEWIEIHNPTTAPIDLTQVWIRTDNDARLWMLQDDLPGPVMIEPGGYFLVWQASKDAPVALVEDGPFRVLYLPQDLFDLTKNDLTVTLKTSDGKTDIHSVTVGPASSQCDPGATKPTITPLTDATKGASLELQPDFFGCADSTLSCDAWAPAWKSGFIPDSADRGTPGQGPEEKPEGGVPMPGSLAVTEIMSRSGEACGKVDWFELLNLTATDLSLEGCTFGDGTATGEKVVKSLVIVPADGYAILAGADMEGVDEDGIISGPNLNMTGDTLYLICGETKIFEVTYGGGEGELPKPEDGKSIGVCFDDLPEPYTSVMLHDPQNWAVTEAGATGCGDDIGSPGVQNILCHCPPVCAPGICDVDDGCGGLCGCGENGTCGDDGLCTCDVDPDCTNKECGDDGCGGSCGVCAAGLTCAQNDAGAWCARTPGADEVVLTEIMSNGGDICGKVDWFELRNLSGDTLNLDGCTIGDDAATGSHVISVTLVIPSEEEIVIAGADMDGVVEDYVTSKPNLNQSNERLWLECPDGADGVIPLFEVWYGTGTEGDLPKTEKGVSIQVCPNLLPDPASASDYLAGANWQLTASAATGCGDDLGTPGLPNPYCDCDPTCTPGECGMDDGCGGLCGCPEGQSCGVDGLCEGPCVPQCEGKECGPDGCGDVCGTCGGGLECIEGLCLAPPALLTINEVNANISGGCDLVELRVIGAGSLGGIVFKERTSTVLTFDPVDVAMDDIIVVHFDSDDANCNPMDAGVETTSKSELAAATYTVTYDMAWDWFISDAGLTATDNVLTIYGPGGDIQDAVFLTDADNGTAAAGTEDQAAIVAAAGEWTDWDGTVPVGGYIDDAFNASAVVGLKDTGTDAAGDTIQRFDNWDTDTNDDWDLWTSSWGLLNEGQ